MDTVLYTGSAFKTGAFMRESTRYRHKRFITCLRLLNEENKVNSPFGPAERLKWIKPSGIRRFFAMANEMPDSINLSIGEPDFCPPNEVLNAGCEAAKEGKTHYEPTNGIPELREALAQKAFKEYGLKYDPSSEILITVGGTEAIFCALFGLINPGDEVLVPGFTFAATAMAVVVARGVPIWCEIDESMTINPEDVEKKITPRTKAIAPVHMSGYVCNMEAIMDIAKRHKLLVIEDCAQSCGSRFKGKRVGTIGNIGCFSISSYKVTGGGESGLVMTDDDKLFDRAQGWAEAGGLWRPDRFAPARWKGELFSGVNYRMSELEGTVELVQFRKMEAQLDRWRKNKKLIMSNLPAYKELRPRVIYDIDGEMGHSIGFFGRTAEEAEQLAHALSAEGVGAGTRGRSKSPDWHHYQYMEMIMNKVPATSDGCPWECPKAGEAAKVKYSFDMCPNTIDILSRHVSAGVNQWWAENDCMKVAQAMTKVFDAFFTRDTKYDNWLSAVASK